MATYVDSSGTSGVPLFTLDGAGVLVPVSAANRLPTATTEGAPTAANVLNGFLTFAATTAATTLITVPADRTWTGKVAVSCAASTAAALTAAGQARAVVTTAGVGVTPAAGTVFAVEAKAAANAATGTVGNAAANSLSIDLVVVAPAGNAVTLQVASTVTTGTVDASASGSLI